MDCLLDAGLSQASVFFLPGSLLRSCAVALDLPLLCVLPPLCLHAIDVPYTWPIKRHLVFEDKGEKSLPFLRPVLLVVETVVRLAGRGRASGMATSHKQGREVVSSGIRKGIKNAWGWVAGGDQPRCGWLGQTLGKQSGMEGIFHS